LWEQQEIKKNNCFFSAEKEGFDAIQASTNEF